MAQTVYRMARARARGAVVRIPGREPTTAAEGIENGLAVCSAAGLAVLIGLGSVGRINPPPGCGFMLVAALAWIED